MCTALTLTTTDPYFGRNLDLDRSYGEEVCIMPRRYPLAFRRMGEMHEHFAMIGMATVMDGIPLYYDAANEFGLAMAGLSFPENAYYAPICTGKDNIASFEFIPWIVGQCKTVRDARSLLARMNLCDIAFSDRIPPSPLHWIITDGDASIVVECRKDGMHIHDNPIGVLTNNPPFEYHMANLEKYRHLRNDNRDIICEKEPEYTAYCQGLGAVGLPGDVSSMSRFARIAFAKQNSVCKGDEASSVGQLFHLLSFVEMPRGICKTDDGAWDITVYSACMNLSRGRYYYTTYDTHRITCVDLHRTNLDSTTVSRYPLVTDNGVVYQN